MPNVSATSLKYYAKVDKKEAQELEAKAKEAGLEYELVCAAQIDRQPIILPDLAQWEKDFYELKQERELMKYKMYDESKFTQPIRRQWVRKDEVWAYDLMRRGTETLGPIGFVPGLKDEVERVRATMDDEHDGMSLDEGTENNDDDDEDDDDDDWDLQLDTSELKAQASTKGFQPLPRITEADKKNDLRTYKRKLDRRVHLIVKVADEKGGSEPVWRLPSTQRRSGERMLHAAQRAVTEQLGEDMDVYYCSYSPAAYRYITYSPEKQKERNAMGAKIFFYRGTRLSGDLDIQNSDEILDYAWILNDELEQFVPNYTEDRYWRVASLLLDD
eukprot:CAMPEP_0203747606 /NCGR_PEP_ID=MMETSP0098-20131031/2678_1 /ASSEMBLY_ACC=CAM_ASM_000208 /TAXON_ID=96639 /ORGANISM=" , Strain NY0313808BC1" /LENGTH=329 /DNA_ID=CAMNT_0050636065 /DNA_START=151 /DNA_END=1140 /DNA_ORIENTATION=+